MYHNAKIKKGTEDNLNFDFINKYFNIKMYLIVLYYIKGTNFGIKQNAEDLSKCLKLLSVAADKI